MPLPIEWRTESRVINELQGYEKNPRRITEQALKRLQESLERYSLTEIPVINTDGTVISGNQRLKVLQAMGKGYDKIDVRVPNRKLSKKEVKELNLLSNTHSGEFDFDILSVDFADIDLHWFGIELPPFSVSPNEFGDAFILPDGDKAPFQQMTFTLADAQAEQIKSAISDIKQTQEYKYAETMGNENSNGNALYLIVMQWAEQRK